MERLHSAPFHHVRILHKHTRKQDSTTTLLWGEKAQPLETGNEEG